MSDFVEQYPDNLSLVQQNLTHEDFEALVNNYDTVIDATGAPARKGQFEGAEYCLEPRDVLDPFRGFSTDKLTKIALLFALAAVLLKGTSLSNFPWIAISMATTFALYAIIRKQLPVKSDTGTLIETIMLAPIAVIYFGWQAQNGAVLFFGADLMGLVLAVFCGLFTITPLYLFHNGNKMLPLAISGLIFYLNPTSQLIISIMLGEPFSFIDISVFVLIWAGLLTQFSPMFFKSL